MNEKELLEDVLLNVKHDSLTVEEAIQIIQAEIDLKWRYQQ